MNATVENRYYSETVQGAYERFALGDFELEGGGVIPDCRLAYTTSGTLNAARDNAVLMPTWYAGTHLVPGKAYVGPGHALDPERYFVVIVNQLGNGVSSAPHNTGLRARFPQVAIGDDVRAQERMLRERFDVERLALVVGASMGAQQALEWAARCPDRVERVAAIAGTATTPSQAALFAAALAEALTSDPAFEGYETPLQVRAGLKRLARLWSLMGFSRDFWAGERWRALGFSSMERFLSGFMEVYFAQMDPHALLVMGDKWRGAAGADLGRITARTLLAPIDTDALFTVADVRAEQAMIAGSVLRELHTPGGHLAIFGFDPDFMAQLDVQLRELLEIT